jgi:regulator of cell morphogenesis and NO signaling
MPTTTEKNVAQIAIENPNAARAFEKLGIDYCCNGKRSLEEACAAANVSVDDVAKRLEESAKEPANAPDLSALSLTELMAHIQDTHHGFIREESPRIRELAAKVARKHGEAHPELLEVREIFDALADELSVHLMKEEQILFPYIRVMEEAKIQNDPGPPAMFGTVANPIRMMEREHDGAGDALRTLRSVTKNYTLPEDACTSYGVLFESLKNFEADLHRHIHLENNLLHPRALAMEERSRGAHSV